MQYAVLIHHNGQFKCDMSTPSGSDAAKVVVHALNIVPNGLHIEVRPIPHLPAGSALPIDAAPYGAISIVDRILKPKEATV